MENPGNAYLFPWRTKEDRMGLEVHQFSCLSDNYGFLIHDPESGETATIDTPDAGAIDAA